MPLDQATALRDLARNVRSQPRLAPVINARRPNLRPTNYSAQVRLTRALCSTSRLRTIAVTSGKGGVGKTSITVNLAIALSRLDQRVLIVDGDLGLANVDVMLGLRPRHSIEQVLSGAYPLDQIIEEGPEGIKIIPGGSGFYDLANLEGERAEWLLRSALKLEQMADVMLIDTSAGISSNVIRLVVSATEMLLVATPEPTSITDAYGVLKVLNERNQIPAIRLVINRVGSEDEAVEAARRLVSAARQFLGISVSYWGCVPDDPNVGRAVMRQAPLMVSYPRSAASRELLGLANRLLGQHPGPQDHQGLGGFFNDLLRR